MNINILHKRHHVSMCMCVSIVSDICGKMTKSKSRNFDCRKKGGNGGEQNGVKMPNSHKGSTSPSGCPLVVPMPSSPKGPGNMSAKVRTLNWALGTKV